MKRMWHVGLAVYLVSGLLWAADRKPNIRITKRVPDPKAESMELFPAMEAGKIEVQLILSSSKQATVLIENKTKEGLNVRMPDAFVAVLAQFGGGGGQQGGGFGGGQQGGGQQQGGFGGGGGQQGGGQQGGGGFFNIPAERVGELRIPGVCLEHGKDEPRAAVKYVIKPVEAFSKDPLLYEMLKLFGDKQINQRVAQVAAWHIASKMSWEELASKQLKRLGQSPQPYFSAQELQAASQLVTAAKKEVEQRGDPKSAPSRNAISSR